MANFANTVLPGEADPTPPTGETKTCGQRNSSGFICTRRPHKRGQHVAGNGRGTVDAVWLDERRRVELQ